MTTTAILHIVLSLLQNPAVTSAILGGIMGVLHVKNHTAIKKTNAKLDTLVQSVSEPVIINTPVPQPTIQLSVPVEDTPKKMALTFKTFIGEVADVAVAEFEANSAPIEALIAAGEVDIQSAVAHLMANIPKPSGIAGALAAPIEAAIEAAIVSAVNQTVAKYGPAVLFALVDKQLHAWATQLGG